MAGVVQKFLQYIVGWGWGDLDEDEPYDHDHDDNNNNDPKINAFFMKILKKAFFYLPQFPFCHQNLFFYINLLYFFVFFAIGASISPPWGVEVGFENKRVNNVDKNSFLIIY